MITAAKNEANYIELTIKSILRQTILPDQWIIVSDGSTDRTYEIIKRYAQKYPFIIPLRVHNGGERNFHSKICAFNAGYSIIKDVDYAFIGNLDADISFESNYFEDILRLFRVNSRLGIAGGWLYELHDNSYRARFGNSYRSVPGAYQLFRKKCFEDISGFHPVETGGEDTLAEIMAKYYGWEINAYPEIKVYHMRDTGSQRGHIIKTRFQQGITDYRLGYHPVYEFCKALLRIKEPPYIIGSIARLTGYFFSLKTAESRLSTDELLKFIRKEEWCRMRRACTPWKRPKR